MNDDILGKVVEVEREVQQQIEIEKKISQEWLERVRNEAEERIQSAVKESHTSLHNNLKEARLKAEMRVSKIISKASREGEELKGIDDEMLKKSILKHVSRIIPLYSHDS